MFSPSRSRPGASSSASDADRRSQRDEESRIPTCDVPLARYRHCRIWLLDDQGPELRLAGRRVSSLRCGLRRRKSGLSLISATSNSTVKQAGKGQVLTDWALVDAHTLKSRTHVSMCFGRKPQETPRLGLQQGEHLPGERQQNAEDLVDSGRPWVTRQAISRHTQPKSAAEERSCR